VDEQNAVLSFSTSNIPDKFLILCSGVGINLYFFVYFYHDDLKSLIIKHHASFIAEKTAKRGRRTWKRMFSRLKHRIVPGSGSVCGNPPTSSEQIISKEDMSQLWRIKLF
jgi:hypothetical protein